MTRVIASVFIGQVRCTADRLILDKPDISSIFLMISISRK